MSEAIETLQKYLSKESNTIYFYGDGMMVKHWADVLFYGNSHDYEAPDMYIKYEDEIWIIEHFEFDCYRSTRKGSSCRIEQSRIDRKMDRIMPTEEGTTYHDTIDANSSYEDYIENVKMHFEAHYRKLAQYKTNLINDNIVREGTRFKVMFLIDDVSPMGTSYIDEYSRWTSIDLAHSREFLNIMNNAPDVDFVLATSCCSQEKFIWFIDRMQLDEYYKNIVDYRSGMFLNFKPHVVGTKILIPDSIIDKEVTDDQL